MKSVVLYQVVLLLLASLVMCVDVTGKSQFCSMQLPRALIAVCGLTKRGDNKFRTDAGHRLGKSRLELRMRLYKRMRIGKADLYPGFSKRGLAPLHVMADVCCRRGCSLEDLLETCRR